MAAPTHRAFLPALPVKRSLSFWLIPALILVIGWAGCGVLVWYGWQRRQAEDRINLARLASNAETSLLRRLTTYTDELEAAAAFIRASHQVDRDEWREYARTIDLMARYPGIRGVGVIYRVPATDRDRFIRDSQAQLPGFALHAVPGYSLSTDELGVITYIEPAAANLPAIGLDIFSEPKRREAARLACDSGRPAMTSRIVLVQDDRNQPGALLFVPVYAAGSNPGTLAERRAHNIGWVYVPLVIEELVTSALGPREGRLLLAFYEGDQPNADRRVFASDALRSTPMPVERVTAVELAGQHFTLAWSKGPRFVPTSVPLLTWAGLSGAVVVLLLTGLVVSIQVAHEVVEREKAELAMRATEERLARVLGHAECFVWESRVVIRGEQWEWNTILHSSALNSRVQRDRSRPADGPLWEPSEVPELPEMDRRSREAMLSGAPGYVQEFRLCREGATIWLRESVAITRDAPDHYWLVGVAVDISDRKRAEAALRESERRLKDVFRSMAEGVVLLRHDGVIVECNDAACRISGRPREQMMSTAVHDLGWELLDEQLRPIALELHPPRITLQTGTAQRGVVLADRKPDGSIAWLSMNTEPITAEDGTISSVVVSFIDITLRKRAEATMLQSQKLLQTITGKLPGMIGYWTADLRCAFANYEYYDWFGRPPEEMLGLRIQDLMGPTLFELNRPFIEGVLAGKAQQFERQLRKRDGQVRHTWAQYIPDFEPDGTTVRGFVVLVSDLTEMKQKEEALQASKAQLQASLREVNDLKTALDAHAIVAVTDANGVITYANDRFCSISECPREKLIGQTHRIVNSGRHSPEFFANLWGTIQSGKIWRGEICNRSLGGRIYWVDATIVPFLGDDGRPVQYIAIRTDITERKQLEQNLAVARDQALEASRLKSEFLATMSHEIRTPMNAIIGMATLLTETVADSEHADMARIITGAAESLLTIINDILDFSRIEAGELRLDLADFDLRRIVEETVALLAPRAHEKKIELTCELDPAPDCLLLGDAGRIRQVLMNLVGNAIKFTDSGEIAVSGSVLSRDERNVRVRLAVEDTGVGIPPMARDRLFRPFVQLDASATRRFGGTGLGLAITRQLVSSMGGEVGFDSTVGRGSRFWVELSFAPRNPLLDEVVPSLAGRRVLVVDDNATSRRLLVHQLAHYGVEAEAVSDAPSARARLAAAEWNAVVIDCDMPGIGGIELARSIRSEAAHQTVPLVMLVTTANKAEAAAIESLGAAVPLAKPVLQLKLLRALERWLDHAENRPVAPALLVEPGKPECALRLLLVEDNPANQRVATLLLENLGHVIEVVSNGHLALERLARTRFDAVLMDCQMPLLDGYETTRWIRSGKLPGVNAGVPVIALTAYARDEDRQRCLDAGMDDYVAKPIRHHDLKAALARVMSSEHIVVTPAPIEDMSEVLDRAAAETAQQLPGAHGGSLLPELIDLYVAEESPRLDRIASLLAEMEPRAADELHAFGGNAAALGGREVRRLALELETGVRAGHWADAYRRLSELRAASLRLRRAITAFHQQSS
jgi:PAS domain S-box-containing protein